MIEIDAINDDTSYIKRLLDPESGDIIAFLEDTVKESVEDYAEKQ